MGRNLDDPEKLLQVLKEILGRLPFQDQVVAEGAVQKSECCDVIETPEDLTASALLGCREKRANKTWMRRRVVDENDEKLQKLTSCWRRPGDAGVFREVVGMLQESTSCWKRQDDVGVSRKLAEGCGCRRAVGDAGRMQESRKSSTRMTGSCRC